MSTKRSLFILAVLNLTLFAKPQFIAKADLSDQENEHSIEQELAQTKRELVQAQSQIKELQRQLESAQTYPLMDTIYVGANGFLIPQQEKDSISTRGGAPTYGEIKYPSLQTLLNDLNIKEDDVFYDLGSGVGKTVIQAHLNFPFKKTVGIELAPTRHKQAEAVADKLKNRMLEFRQDDMLETDLSDATVIYLCSTCFSDELMNKLLNKFAKLKNGLVVITLKELPDRYPSAGFELVKKYNLPMSWSAGNTVHVYKLTKNI